MYALVNDVASYPVFVPWCSGIVLHEKAEQRLIATIAMGVGKIKQHITTENTMQPGKRIDMKLVEGPFKHLNGYWLFEDMDDAQCRVSMQMNFEFKNKVLKLALNKAYEQINHTSLEVFSRRARELYGSK